VLDLVRRIDVHPDLEPDKGGRVDVVATDIDLFDLEYLDPLTGLWAEEWDSTQATDQPDRLPVQVRITLVLNGGRRKATERAHDMLKYVTKVAIPMNHPLSFAIDQ
jgi:general secretion pathway protein J